MNSLIHSFNSCTINKYKIVYAKNGIFDEPEVPRHNTELVKMVEQENICCDCDLFTTIIDNNIYKIYKQNIYNEIVLEPKDDGYTFTESKIVVISKYSIFQISPDVANYMANKGDKEAIQMIHNYQQNNVWFGFISETNRHNPLLVEAIETFGIISSGYYCNITFQSIEHNYYKISGTLDQIEKVFEPFMDDYVYI